VFAVLEAGRHCLVEKPVCHDYRDVLRAHRVAKAKGLKSKVGLTFRYAPAVMYMFDLIRDGFIAQPFIFNGYEQNSQWLDPEEPLRQADPDADIGPREHPLDPAVLQKDLERSHLLVEKLPVLSPPGQQGGKDR